MKKRIPAVLMAMAVLIVGCLVAAPQSLAPGEVDAASIPESQRESRYEVSISLLAKSNPNEVSLKPVPTQPAIYRQIRPAVELTLRPRARMQTLPNYPHELAIRGIPGRVVVAYVVDAKGHVIKPKIIEASDERFAKPVIETIKQWTYVPGTLDGVPVSALLVIEITFRRENG